MDGDGVPDTAVLREWGHVWGGLRDALVVRTGSGRQLRLAIDDDMGSSRYPTNKLLGADDVNSDGRDELVVFTSGNTELAGVIVTDVDGRLRAARSTEGVPYFSAHGNSCGPCTQDATCQMWRGKPRLVETESFYLSRRGRDLTLFEMAATHDNAPFDEHRRRWQATVYDLREDRFVKIKTLHGVVAAGAPLPRDFHFDGALDCGSAHLHL